MDILVKIKRMVLTGNVLFTKKAELEMDRDSLSEELVMEAILNAPGISKVIRSKRPSRGGKEYLYVIVGLTYDDIPVYTKGKIVKSDDRERFYVLISSKRSVD
jgi:hypothetical protein